MILRTAICAVVLAGCTGMFAGCATTGRNASLRYKPVVAAGGGSGVVFLSLNGSPWRDPQERRPSRLMRRLEQVSFRPRKKTAVPPMITVVNVKSGYGRTIAKRVMPVYSGDLLVDALKQELSAAGYTVLLVEKLPKNAGTGIDISSVYANLEQNSALLTLDGRCHLQIKVDMWRNGAKHASHEYATTVSDYSIVNQSLLHEELMLKAVQNIMRKAVPDIYKDFSTLRA